MLILKEYVKAIFTFTFVLCNLFAGAQITGTIRGRGLALDRWYRTGLNFETIVSPENKTGERGTYATFEIINPFNNQPPPSQFKERIAAAVFYSTNQELLSNFRQNIQNIELQDIQLPSPTRTGSVFKIGAKNIGITTNKATFRAIYPHDNHIQFWNTVGKFPRGTKIYYFWVYGVPYKSEVTFHTDPDSLNRHPITRVKYLYSTITDNAIKSFIMPRELIVAIAGESNSSGEGAPSPGNQPWTNENCHRSLQSGMYLGLEAYVNEHPELSILYKDFFVGCSGATIPDLITSTNSAEFNLLSNAIASHGLAHGPDVLLLSIGGNDVNFHDIALWLFIPGPELNISLIRNKIGLEPSDLFRNLNEKYRYLNDAIKYLRVKKTFLLGYPDLTHSTIGTFCGLPFDLDALNVLLKLAADIALNTADYACPGDCFSTPVLDYFENRARCYGSGVWSFVEQLVDATLNFGSWDDWADTGTVLGDFVVELGSTNKEYEYLYNTFLLNLNNSVKENCQLYNWGYISGAAEMTKAHGFCNCSEPYFNTLSKSFIIQNDANGVAHLNRTGHSMVNKVIVENTLTNYLTDSTNRRELTIFDTGSNPNTSRVYNNPDFNQKIQEFRAFDADIKNKISIAKKADKQIIIASIQTLTPQLIKLRDYFHQKALVEK